MQYVIKLGAYGLAGVAAFAVAVALMLSVSSTPTAEALVVDTADGVATEADNQTVTKSNGDTVYIRFINAGFATFEISTTGSASASFTHADASEDGQSITCASGAACDAESNNAATVTVALKIDDDSGKGNIFVKQTTITGNGTETTDAITVKSRRCRPRCR